MQRMRGRQRLDFYLFLLLSYPPALKLARATPSLCLQIIGILGCMAERLKHSLIEGRRKSDGTKLIRADLVAGPDAYRDLPRLLDLCMGESIAEKRENGSVEEEKGNKSRHEQEKPLRRVGAVGNLQSQPPSPINVQLSLDETYADIAPVRPASQVGFSLSPNASRMLVCTHSLYISL